MYSITMHIILHILNIFVLIRTCSYSMYEIKVNNNKIGGIISIVLQIIVFSLIIYLLFRQS